MRSLRVNGFVDVAVCIVFCQICWSVLLGVVIVIKERCGLCDRISGDSTTLDGTGLVIHKVHLHLCVVLAVSNVHICVLL